MVMSPNRPECTIARPTKVHRPTAAPAARIAPSRVASGQARAAPRGTSRTSPAASRSCLARKKAAAGLRNRGRSRSAGGAIQTRSAKAERAKPSAISRQAPPVAGRYRRTAYSAAPTPASWTTFNARLPRYPGTGTAPSDAASPTIRYQNQAPCGRPRKDALCIAGPPSFRSAAYTRRCPSSRAGPGCSPGCRSVSPGSPQVSGRGADRIHMESAPDVASDASRFVHVGRQPIYDTAGQVVAFELLFRASAGSDRSGRGDASATVAVIVNTFGEFGLADMAGELPCFVNLTRDFLTGRMPLPFGPQQSVLEALETVEIDDEVLAGVAKLAGQGYRIALDDFVRGSSHERLLELASVVKLDLQATSPEDLARIAATGARY